MNKELLNLFAAKTYEDVLYEWLNERKKEIKESSYIKYLNQIETNIIPNLKNISFKKLRPCHIISIFNSDNVKNLSNSTKNNILIIINSSINYGIKKKYRRRFKKLEIKFKKQINEVTYFTKKEQELITSYLNKNMNLRNFLILVALFTGIRIGELCALKGTDVDFINNTISVKRTVQRIKDISNSKNKTKLIIGKPKTKSSIRTIPVPEFIIELFKQYITDNNNFIFTNSNKPKDPRTVEKYFADLLKKIGVKNLNFHSLRHTYATRLREKKVDIKVISELLGHSDWRVTQAIYVHASFECKKDSINELNGLWSSKKFVEVI